MGASARGRSNQTERRGGRPGPGTGQCATDVRDPSKQKPARCRAPPGTDDDHVGVILRREFSDRVSGVSDLAAGPSRASLLTIARELRDLAIDLHWTSSSWRSRRGSAALPRERVLRAVHDRHAASPGSRAPLAGPRPVGGLGAVGCPYHVLVHLSPPGCRGVAQMVSGSISKIWCLVLRLAPREHPGQVQCRQNPDRTARSRHR